MGIWGTGNFERDDALDVLVELYDHIIEEIRTTFAEESEETLYDDRGEDHIVANVDIINTLAQHYKCRPILETEDVIRWKQDYLSTFDRTIHEYSSSTDYIQKRRDTVVATFDRLYQIITGRWSD
jgi:hypothetical protein